MGDFLYGPDVEAALSSRGQIFTGSCNDDMTGSTTAIHVNDLRKFSDDFFNVKYYMIILKDYNDVGDAPEGECRQITDYVSDTGVFTTAAFTANVEANDRVIVMHESIALFALHADADHSRVVNDSWLAQMLTVDGTIANYNDNTMSQQAIAALVTNANQQLNITTAIEADELHYLMALATSDIAEPVNMSPEIANNSVIANILDDGGVTANYDRRYHALNAIAAGTTRIAVTTEELAAAAGDKDLFTGTTTDVILESLSLRNAAVDCSDDAGGFTGISIQTDDTTPATIIAQADGVKANLTSEAQLGWIGTLVIKTDTKIQLTIYGAAADAACAPDIIAKFRSTGSGNGTLVA